LKQILLTAGIVLGIFQLFVLPRAIRHIGIVRWQRASWVLGLIAFAFAPNAKILSWNFPTLFTMGMASILLVICSMSGVRKISRYTGGTQGKQSDRQSVRDKETEAERHSR